MTIGLLTNIVSPHQLPMAEQLAKIVGNANFRYIFTESFHHERTKMGWSATVCDGGLRVERMNGENLTWLTNADFVYCSERDFDLMEDRLRSGRPTFYMSERWLKPYKRCPGWLRLLHPKYSMMARRVVKMFEYPAFRYLAQGKWAEHDMKLIYRFMHPRTSASEAIRDRIIPWGYFVAPSSLPTEPHSNSPDVRILWVGRMLQWKRVDTIIKAVRALDPKQVSLTLIGDGDVKERLEAMARGAKNIVFKDSIPIDKIRSVMRQHDVYVLASDGNEGWGAALNEAIEEGMLVLGTHEAGASSSILPADHLFHAGDWKSLSRMLSHKIAPIDIGEWSASRAALRLIKIAEGV